MGEAERAGVGETAPPTHGGAENGAKAKLELDDAFAERTKRGYASDWGMWTAWCAEAGHQPLPASGEAISAYIDASSGKRKPATLSRHIAAIAAAHRIADLPDPTKLRVVKVAMKRLARQHGTRQTQALGLNWQMRDKMLAAAGTDITGLRDRALLSVAYDIGRRRSEVVSLLVEDIDRAEDGTATIVLRRSKTDQEGQGQICYLSAAAVKAVDAWLDAAGVEDGPIFRALRNNGKVGPEAIQGRAVSNLYKKLGRAAGFPRNVWSRLSGHSTRVGLAQDMAAAGIDLVAIMQAGGWKSPAMASRYCERLDVRRGGAARLAVLQGRSPAT
ncbi:hypothetical protein WV31_10610 [Magnetospirillum sp. ME-1]|nr:hypothetical protein WV31_10610 [Magnetospirillum sp. ME-1]